jgi:hypothetical protein
MGKFYAQSFTVNQIQDDDFDDNILDLARKAQKKNCGPPFTLQGPKRESRPNSVKSGRPGRGPPVHLRRGDGIP